MDSVIIPINEEKIADIIFENSEDIPNDVYINLMKMMKDYHNTNQNGQEIKEYLYLNKARIDTRVYRQIIKQIKNPTINVCSCSCSSVINLLIYILVIGVIFIIPVVVIYSSIITTKKNVNFDLKNNTN